MMLEWFMHAPSRAAWRGRARVLLATVVSCVWVVSIADICAAAAPIVGAGAALYVGAKACAPCHAKAYESWRGSHHALAMQPADEHTVLASFNRTRFTYAGISSTFFKRDGKFFVNTDGPDGVLADYEIAYTFGVSPLQQYLIAFPNGGLQALGIAWDTRPKQSGGQRWFHLYPDDKVDFRDVLHWSGPAQNWNYMCSECHSTNVRKNYDADSGHFATTWSEIDVSCEACHGPGSEHVEWGRRVRAAAAKGAGVAAPKSTPSEPLLPDHGVEDSKGLVVNLAAPGGAWVFDAGAPIAHLSGARDTHPQVICARCHARRAQMGEDYDQTQPLGQTHMLALLSEPLYHADGQILDEVFEYGSFLQSAMHARGVVCGDCHDSHSGQLRAAGNAVCAKCHQPSHYDTPAHHHHKAGTDAARCVGCHMLARTYMVVHTRHDHSFRVPRPDLSVTLGTPNACTDCHKDRAPQWAADAVVKWYGPTRSRGPRYAAALAAGRKHQAGADRLLADVVANRSFPVIVRATALSLLENFPGASMALVERSLQDEDPLLRREALSLLVSWEPQRRWQLGAPLLSDPIRAVRFAAVVALADVPGAMPPQAMPPAVVPITAEQRIAFDHAVVEYRAMQAFNADRAEAWLNLGALDVRLGNPAPAVAAYQRAIALQPSFMPAYVNLADLYREQERDVDGERVLRQGLGREPGVADVHHALGLLLVRQKRMDEALAELARAAQLDRDSPRYAYVYAIALDSVGQRQQALAVLAAAQHRFSADRDILAALVQLAGQSGDAVGAAQWAQQLRGLERR